MRFHFSKFANAAADPRPSRGIFEEDEGEYRTTAFGRRFGTHTIKHPDGELERIDSRTGRDAADVARARRAGVMHGEKRRRLSRDAFFQDAADRRDDANLVTSLTQQGAQADAQAKAAVAERKKAFGAMLQGADAGPPVREIDQFERADKMWQDALTNSQTIAGQKTNTLDRIARRRSSLLDTGRESPLDGFKKIPHSWER